MNRMLLLRSIFLQVCLLLAISQCKSEDYESGYEIEEDDHGDVQDDSGRVDYTKYFAADSSAPLISSQGNLQFTRPIEHAGFFAPSIDFGASVKQEVAEPKNPFVAQTKNLGFIASQEPFPAFFEGAGVYPIDYFEEAQKTQRKETDDEAPESFISPEGFTSGPDYISHHITPSFIEGDYSSDSPKVQGKPSKKYKSKKKYDYEEDGEKEASNEEKYKSPNYSYEYQPSAPSGKYADYSTGKSSSTVSQHPDSSLYQEELTQTPTVSPYQKYSFQPVTEEGGFKSKYLDSLISTVAPFNPAYNKIASTAVPNFETQPSENVPSHLKNKNCVKVQKQISGEGHSRRKREAMNCYVCEDPENNSKITQCSYAVEPEPVNAYSGKSERYSTPGNRHPDGFRYKRYSEEEEKVDPYEFIKSRSQKYYSDPQESKDYEEYSIPEFYTEDGHEKSYSEVQSESVAKNPANCQKKESDGMTCTVCKDPKTGGNYEQCSYTSAPKEQKYAYVTEKKYDSDDEPEEGSESNPIAQTKEANSEENKDQEAKKEETSEDYKHISLPSNDDAKYSKLEDFKPAEDYKANFHGHESLKLSEQYNPDSKEDSNSKREEYNPPQGFKSGDGGKKPNKLIDDEPYDIPKHFAESTIKEQKSGVRGLEPSLYGSSDSAEVEGEEAESSESESVEPYKDIEEYHFKLFPEFSNEESKQAEVVANNPSAETTRKDVEEVLAEFSKKDRSACKKAQKNGMTCYLCVDDKGIQHEECMYVSESKPQASHLAYHEVKQIKSPKAKTPEELEQEPAETEVKTKEIFQSIATTIAPATMEAAASEGFETRVKYNKKNRRRSAKKAKEPVTAPTDDDEKLVEEEDEPKLKSPTDYADVGAEEGAFSDETKPAYSKVLGVKLPKYMIEKSEFEKEFDEFSGVNY